jgi:hypothetical protein
MTAAENRRRVAMDRVCEIKKILWNNTWSEINADMFKCDHPAHRKYFRPLKRGLQAVCKDCELERKRKMRGNEPALP